MMLFGNIRSIRLKINCNLNSKHCLEIIVYDMSTYIVWLLSELGIFMSVAKGSEHQIG